MKICFGCFEQYDDSFDICPHCGYAEGTEPELATYMRPGAILKERYVIGRALGHGGFSVTYLAWDALLLHKVAIKEYLPSEYATRRPGESRLTVFTGKEGEYFQFGKEKFLDEAKRLSAFQDEEGIVHVYDCFSANETAYLVMEYLDGITLSEYLKKESAVSPQGRIAPEKAIAMLTPIMLSLQRVHDSGMIHRDIAPDNIMVLKDGGVRLIDFGAARHAVHDCGKSMTVIIKDGYSPEEQYNSHGVQGPAADVYALSATLYQMMTGVTPPGAIERGEYLQQHKRDLLPPPSKYNKAITKAQETALLNGMALHTQERTQSVAELYEELTAQTPARRVQETIRKRGSFSWPLWAKIAAGVLTAAIAAGGVLLYLNRGQKPVVTKDGYVLSPNVVNMQVVDAVATAEKASLRLVVEGSDYDAGVEQGRILSQDPKSGTKLEPSSDLRATASLGKERPAGTMGDTTSMLKDAAEDYLTQMGISDKQIKWEYVSSSTEMPGTIVDQSVTPGSPLTSDSKITLRVVEEPDEPVTPLPEPPSDGSDSDGSVDIAVVVPSADSYVTVRDYVGQPFDTAKQDLRTLSLYGVKCALRYHPSIPSGSIIQQSPASGEQVLKGTGVYFVVSLGPQKQLVPNVLYKDQAEAERLRQGVESTVFNFGGQTSNVATYREISVSGLLDGGDLRLGNAGASAADSTRVTQLHFLPLEDYNAATGQSLTLNDGQVYVAALRTDFPYDTLTVDGEWTFRVMDRDIPPLSGPFTADITPTLMVVMPHFTQFVQELEDGLSEKYGWYLTATWHYAFDTDLPENQQGNIDGTTPNLEDALNGYLAGVSSDWGVGVSVESKAANRADFYGTYGGLFFLGIMLSIVFIFAAVAILYYKQLSEGYEDQSRFDIMQKVGMTKVDIRRSINSQLLTVFYLPLVLAGVHLCFAFPFIHKLLILFNLDNRGLLIGTTAVSFAVFAVLYAIVYKLTGNTYYRIVAEDTEKE